MTALCGEALRRPIDLSEGERSLVRHCAAAHKHTNGWQAIKHANKQAHKPAAELWEWEFLLPTAARAAAAGGTETGLFVRLFVCSFVASSATHALLATCARCGPPALQDTRARRSLRGESVDWSVGILPVRLFPVRLFPVRLFPLRLFPLRLFPLRLFPLRLFPLRRSLRGESTSQSAYSKALQAALSAALSQAATVGHSAHIARSSSHLGYSHLGCSHLGYSHLGYSHLGYSHLGCSHLGYSHLGYSHLGYSHLGCRKRPR